MAGRTRGPRRAWARLLLAAACLAVPLGLWAALPLTTSGASTASQASSLQSRLEKARAKLQASTC